MTTTIPNNPNSSYTDSGNPYPSSRPFLSKYNGTCAYSGTRYRKGDTIRCIIDGWDSEASKGINPRFVRECFVNMACGFQNWTRLTDQFTVPDAITDGDRFLLVDKNGNEKGVYTFRDGRICHTDRYYAGTSRSLAQMKRTFDAAIAINILKRR